LREYTYVRGEKIVIWDSNGLEEGSSPRRRLVFIAVIASTAALTNLTTIPLFNSGLIQVEHALGVLARGKDLISAFGHAMETANVRRTLFRS